MVQSTLDEGQDDGDCQCGWDGLFGYSEYNR